MQIKDVERYMHDHVFDTSSHSAEKGTKIVMWISAAMMVIEIVFGWLFNSMALLADGWHMSSHTLAIGLSALAYGYARRYARDPRFAFGTWKIEVLGGFTSAIFLLGVALVMFISSFERIYDPTPIQYAQAIWIAALGLVVNLVCALILARSGAGHDHHGHAHGHHEHDHHDHGHHGHDHHDHDHDHDHDHHDHAHHDHRTHGDHVSKPHLVGTHTHLSKSTDLNLRSAYIHILADAATSILAIFSLAMGWAYGVDWLDPVVGILGAVLIAIWSKNLISDSALILLDCELKHPKMEQIRHALTQKSTGKVMQVVDLHVWRVGKNSFTCAVAIVTSDLNLTPEYVRTQLLALGGVAHTTIEVNYV